MIDTIIEKIVITDDIINMKDANIYMTSDKLNSVYDKIKSARDKFDSVDTNFSITDDKISYKTHNCYREHLACDALLLTRADARDSKLVYW